MIIDCVSTVGANMNGCGDDIPNKQRERMIRDKQNYIGLFTKLVDLLEKGEKNEPN
jgi:hypothetical protein